MHRSRKPALVAAVYLGTIMATLAISTVSVALPAIQADLGTSLTGLQWVVGSYALGLSAVILSAGPIGDRYGRRRAWLSGIGLFTVGSAISATAASLAVLITGCAVQGVAGALVIPGALSILTQAFSDPAERAHVIGGWSSFSAISLIVGPMLGGALVDNVGWPSIFLINIPIGMVTVGLGLWGVPESADPDHAALDPAGQVLAALFLGMLTFTLIGAGNAGWTAPVTVAGFGVVIAALAAFIAVEKRVARPVLPADLFRDGAFAVVNFASFVLGFSGYSSLFLFSLFLQQAQGWSATAAGWRMAPIFVAQALVAFLFGRLAARHGLWCLMILGYVLLGVAMLAMTAFTPTTSAVSVALLFAVLGVGMGLAVPSTGAAAMVAAPRERTGAASATMNALRQGGMTIGIALLGTVMSERAISSMTTNLTAARIADAVPTAALAVGRHEMPPGLDMVTDTFRVLLAQAFADGFSAAVACAGVLGLVASAALAIAARRAGRRPNAGA